MRDVRPRKITRLPLADIFRYKIASTIVFGDLKLLGGYKWEVVAK